MILMDLVTEGRTCANNLDELACIVEASATPATSAPTTAPSNAPTKSGKKKSKSKSKSGKGSSSEDVVDTSEDCVQVEVCSGEEILFENPQIDKVLDVLVDEFGLTVLAFEGIIRDIISFIRSGMTIEVPDNTEIVCEGGCDCTLTRPLFTLFYSLCPFFTTQVGNDFALSGFQFMSDDVLSQENILSFSNYDEVDLSTSDITITSEVEDSACDAPTGVCEVLPAEEEEEECESKSKSEKSPKRRRRELRRHQEEEEMSFVSGSGGSSNSNGNRKYSPPKGDSSSRYHHRKAADSILADTLFVNHKCSTKENIIVDEFILDDKDNDLILTCDEAKVAITSKLPNFPIGGFRCDLLFQELVNMPDGCFIMTNTTSLGLVYPNVI